MQVDERPGICYVLAMPAVLEQVENVSEQAMNTSETAMAKVKVYQPWQFQPGMKGGPGRPKGVKNAETALLRSAPKLAKAYIKEGCKGNAAILTDARKWIMPTDGESAGAQTNVVIFSGDGALPRLTASTLQTPCIDAETMSLPAVSPSLADPQAR